MYLSSLTVFLLFPLSCSLIHYSDQLSRHKLIYAAIAAYGTVPQSCLDQGFNDSQVKRQITVPCDSEGDTCSGFTAVSHDDKAVLVVFRGTTSNEQLVVEGVETVFANKKPWISGGSVSEYFSDAFYKIWSAGMKDDVNILASKFPDYQVWVTGHSLGGSMASLAASYLSFNKLAPNLLLVTFGQPRTGDLNFTQNFDYLVPNSYRITHSHDPVPHVPGKGHHGYYHHKSEVFYNEKMTGWEICEEDEGQKCSDSNAVDLDFQAGLVFFLNGWLQ